MGEFSSIHCHETQLQPLDLPNLAMDPEQNGAEEIPTQEDVNGFENLTEEEAQAMDELATDMEREMQLVNESKTPEARTSPPSVNNNMTTSASTTSFGNARVENETIKKWREEQAKRLEEKDDNEAKM